MSPSFETDPLATAALTPEQRLIWDATRRQLAEADRRAHELEKQLKAVPPEDHPAILTRPEFKREVARMLALDDRYGGTSSILYFDFGRLNQVTIKHGRAVANATSREITETIMKNVRTSDIVGRLGGDEYGVLLIRCGNAEAWVKAQGLAALLHETVKEIQGCKLDIEINYGAYTFEGDADVATGLKQAALALTKNSHT